MKFLDKVKVINDNDNYKKEGVFSGMRGTIIDAEIRNNHFNVIFIDERIKDLAFIDKNFTEIKDDIICAIKIDDLQLLEDMHCTDEKILESLPKSDPRWWCKVEDGYILNLLGERKNKTAYKYNS